MKTVIVQASSRSTGNTQKIVRVLQDGIKADLIDLSKLNIGQYCYENKNEGDDFLPAIRKIAEYDLVIFATPVYWYSMSGLLKTFLDRITECLKTEKETGRKLRGKNMAAISCGSESTEIEGFFVPFKLTAEYLGMNYLGDVHTWISDENPGEEVFKRINKFSSALSK